MAGSVIVRNYATNPLSVSVAAPGVGWNVIAKDGTPYASLALLRAAGKKTLPGLDPGGKPDSCMIHSVTSAGVAGSGWYYALDRTTAPTDADSDNVIGPNDQQIVFSSPFRFLWLRALVGTDILKVEIRY